MVDLPLLSNRVSQAAGMNYDPAFVNVEAFSVLLCSLRIRSHSNLRYQIMSFSLKATRERYES